MADFHKKLQCCEDFVQAQKLPLVTVAYICHEQFHFYISFVKKKIKNLTFHKQQNYKRFLALTSNCHLQLANATYN